MTEEKDLINKPTQGEITASSSNVNWDDFFSKEEREKRRKFYELEAEFKRKAKEVEDKLNEIENGKVANKEEIKSLKEKNAYVETLAREIEQLEKELRIYEGYGDSDSDYYLSEEEELSASTTGGKEVIKAEISEKLLEARKIFAEFQISETTQETITRKINENVDEKMKNIWSGENTFVNTVSFIPIVGNLVGPAHAAEHSRNLEKNLKRQAKEIMPAVVNKLITKATTDLEKKKKKVLKVMDALIESREKEVFAAKDAITKMESVIEGLKDKNTDLIKKNQEDKKLSEQAINKVKKQSDEEIEKLQEGIRELNEQLKDHRKQKEDAENFFKKQREARIKKEMDGQSNINSPIQDPQAKIERLEKNLDDLEMELKIVRSDRDLIKRELEDKKNELAREKTFFNNEIKRQVELSQLALQNKENELARKETEREKNNNTWQETYNRLKEEKERIERNWNRAEKDKEELEEKLEEINETKIKPLNKKISELEKTVAEKKELISKKETELTAKNERIKDLEEINKPSLLFSVADKLGLVSKWQTITNISILTLATGFIYAVSLMWKYWIKPAYRNFRGEPKRKERVRYDDYEEIEESEEKKPTIIIRNSPPAEKNSKKVNSQKRGKK